MNSTDVVPSSDLPQGIKSDSQAVTNMMATPQEQDQSNVVPASDLPEQAQNQNVVPQSDLPPALQQGSLGQGALASVEGIAQGFAGPVATGAEMALSKGAAASGLAESTDSGYAKGFSPEDITQREQQYPVTHGISEAVGLGAGLYTGVGEAALVARAAEAIPILNAAKSSGFLLKYASRAANGAAQVAALSALDDTSKIMLGQESPNAAVSNFYANHKWQLATGSLANVAVGGLFDLRDAARAKISSKFGDQLKKFAAYFADGIANPVSEQDFADAANGQVNDFNTGVTSEMQNLHGNVEDAMDSTWGDGKAKDAVINHLSQGVSEQNTAKHVQSIAKFITDAPESLKNNKTFQDAVTDWYDAVKQPEEQLVFNPETGWREAVPQTPPSASDIFKATDTLKKQVQGIAKFNSTSLVDKPAIAAAKELQFSLRQSLEDQNVWGELGKVQQQLNEAAHKLFPSLQNFNKAFSETFADDMGRKSYRINPGKVISYIKNNMNLKVSNKTDDLVKFISDAHDFMDQVGEIHNRVGLPSPIDPIPMRNTGELIKNGFNPAKAKDVIDGLTSGAKAALWLNNGQAAKFFGKATVTSGAVKLAGPAGLLGATNLIPEGVSNFAANTIGKPMAKAASWALLKAVQSSAYENAASFVKVANKMTAGEKLISNHLDALFGKNVIPQALNQMKANQQLKDWVDAGGIDAEMEKQNNAKNKTLKVQQKPPGYAEGGQVQPDQSQQQQMLPGNTTLSPIEKNDYSSDLSAAYPGMTQSLMTTRSRVFSYLNSIKPDEQAEKTGQLPYDSAPDMSQKEKVYDQAITIGANPLSILKNVKDGSITPDQLNHLNSMYPEIQQHLAQEITKKIVDNKLSGEKPAYKTRQGLSMFLGTPLDSTFTPHCIMATQNVFMNQRGAQQQSPPPKKSPSKSKMDKTANNYMTQDQATIARQQA
jgi:hypothetical protein